MGLVPARRPGWLLEGRGDPSPRGMAAQSRRKARWTEPGLQALWHFHDSPPRLCAGGTLNGEKLWLGNRDRTTGDSRAGGPTAKAGTPRRCACAIATAAPSLATVPRPKLRTAPSAGTSARLTQPSTTRTGIISRASARKKPHGAQRTKRAVRQPSA